MANDFIDFVVLGNYQEKIIHGTGMDIQTENGLGKYHILTSYNQNETAKEFSISIEVKYIDSQF